jgi:septum formation topological specificity factor MinE
MLSGHGLTVAEVARLRLALTKARERLAASEAHQVVLRSLRREIAVLLDKITRSQSQAQHQRR